MTYPTTRDGRIVTERTSVACVEQAQAIWEHHRMQIIEAGYGSTAAAEKGWPTLSDGRRLSWNGRCWNADGTESL